MFSERLRGRGAHPFDLSPLALDADADRVVVPGQAYRRLRQVAGIAQDPVLDGTSLEAIGEEAIAWMLGQS